MENIDLIVAAVFAKEDTNENGVLEKSEARSFL